MTDFNDIKTGDHVRVTSVYEGVVTYLEGKDTLKLNDSIWVDLEAYPEAQTVTIEIIEKPREIGWWEVEVDDCGLPLSRTFRWDGNNWLLASGNLTPWKNHKINPLHYIGPSGIDSV